MVVVKVNFTFYVLSIVHFHVLPHRYPAEAGRAPPRHGRVFWPTSVLITHEVMIVLSTLICLLFMYNVHFPLETSQCSHGRPCHKVPKPVLGK